MDKRMYDPSLIKRIKHIVCMYVCMCVSMYVYMHACMYVSSKATWNCCVQTQIYIWYPCMHLSELQESSREPGFALSSTPNIQPCNCQVVLTTWKDFTLRCQ